MLKLAQPEFTEEEIERVGEVLRSGTLVQGENVKKFEERITEYIGAKYAVAVTSGTAALHLALLSLGIGPGDAVFVPAFTFPATVNVIEIVGARPILVDVDLETYNITYNGLVEAFNNWRGPEKPKAIIPVHEFGAPCNMDGICSFAKQKNLYIIEDSACALGSFNNDKHVGTFGDLGCFSFHPRKAITTGEGGVIVTDNYKLFKCLLLLRNHGMNRDAEGNVDFYLPGLNYRMTEFQAVLGISQLDKFDYILKVRKRIVQKYNELLSQDTTLKLPKLVIGHSWQTYMIILPENIKRQMFIEYLKKNNIESNLGAQAIHMLKFYKEKYKNSPYQYPISKLMYERGLSIPIHGSLKLEDVKTICEYVLRGLKAQVEA